MNAAQLAVDEINAAGGINGYKVEFMSADDMGDAQKAVNAYNDLKDKGMQILIGHSYQHTLHDSCREHT